MSGSPQDAGMTVAGYGRDGPELGWYGTATALNAPADCPVFPCVAPTFLMSSPPLCGDPGCLSASFCACRRAPIIPHLLPSWTQRSGDLDTIRSQSVCARHGAAAANVRAIGSRLKCR